MSLNELQKFQSDSVYQDKNWNWVWWAMWKYQIVTGTLQNLITSMWLTGDEKFTPELQDKMAMALMGGSYEAYQNWEITADQLQDKVSWLWASVKDSTWKGTYDSDWTNKATFWKEAFTDMLQQQQQGQEEVKTININQKTFLDWIEKISDLSSKVNMAAMEEIGLTLNDALAYRADNITASKSKDYTTALWLIDKMMNAWWKDGFSDAIWVFSLARRTADDWTVTYRPWTDAADFKAQYDALVDWLTLPNLDKMSWVLTDKDIELLKNASKWGLSLSMSETDFKASVEDLRKVLQKAITGNTEQEKTNEIPDDIKQHMPEWAVPTEQKINIGWQTQEEEIKYYMQTGQLQEDTQEWPLKINTDILDHLN